MSMWRHPTRSRAIALIWVAVTALLMASMMALVIDSAHALFALSQLQNGADSAALAGVHRVRGANSDYLLARQAAVNLALANQAALQPIQLRANLANDPAGDIVLGFYSRKLQEFFPSERAVNAVKVVARRTNGSLGGPVDLLFSSLLGVANVQPKPSAIAMRAGGAGAGLIVLKPTTDCTLLVHGTVYLNIRAVVDRVGNLPDEAGIQVNSDHECAACLQGNTVVDADVLNTVGDTCFIGGAVFNGFLNPLADFMDDPLAWVLPPSFDRTRDLSPPDKKGNPSPVSGNGDDDLDGLVDEDPAAGIDDDGDGLIDEDPVDGIDNDGDGLIDEDPAWGIDDDGDGYIDEDGWLPTQTIYPGYYSAGISHTGGKPLILDPGVYVLGGAGLDLGGNNSFTALGVMFYIETGRVDLTGSGQTVITSIDPITYPVSIARDFTSPGYAYYTGISMFQARSNTTAVRIIGTSLLDIIEGILYFPVAHTWLSGTGDGFGTQIITWTMRVSGTGVVTINYDGRNPAPGGDVFLVQ